MFYFENEEEEQNIGCKALYYYRKIYKLSQLKPKLTCSICLQMYNAPTLVFDCHCIFCEECINTYFRTVKEDEPLCPICQIPVKRNCLRSLVPFGNTVQRIKEYEQSLRNLFNTEELEELPHSTIYNILLKKRNDTSYLEFENITDSKSDPENASDVIESVPDIDIYPFLITLDNEVTMVFDKTEVKSFAELCKRMEPERKKRVNKPNVTPNRNKKENASNTVQNRLEKQTGESVSSKKENIDNTNQNRLKKANNTSTSGNIKHYIKVMADNSKNKIQDKTPSNNMNSSKTNIKESAVNNTIKTLKSINTRQHTKSNIPTTEFQDKTMKVDILQWLADNRNKFNHILTPEENFFNTPQTNEWNLTSISQINKKHAVRVPQSTQINKHKLEGNRIRERTKQVVKLTRSCRKELGSQRRTRSLECSVKTIEPERFLKRHSFTTCHSPDADIIIEQTNSEEESLGINKCNDKNNIVNLIEDEYINKIDHELQSAAKVEPNSPKQRKKISSLIHETIKEANKRIESLTVNSAWEPANAIKRTIGKTERKASKLKLGEDLHTSCSVVSGLDSVKPTQSSSKNKLAQSANNHNIASSDDYNKPSTSGLGRVNKKVKKQNSVVETSKHNLRSRTKMHNNINDQIVNCRENENSKSLKPNKSIQDLKVVSPPAPKPVRKSLRKRTSVSDSREVKNAVPKKQAPEQKQLVGDSESATIINKDTEQYPAKLNKDIGEVNVAVVNLVKLPITNKSEISNEIIENKKGVGNSIADVIDKSQEHPGKSRTKECDSDIVQEKYKKDDERHTENTDISVLTKKSKDKNKTLTISVEEDISEKNIKSLSMHKTQNKQSLCSDVGESTDKYLVESSKAPTLILGNKLPQAVQKNVSLNQLSECTPPVENINTNVDDDIFLIPTQKNIFASSQTVHELLHPDDEEIFGLATQVILSNDKKCAKTLLKEKMSELKDMLNELSGSNGKDVNIIAKLKDITLNMESLISTNDKQHETRDIDIQTNDSKELFSQSVSTQTRTLTKDIGMQTDCESPKGFHISSTALFDIPTVVTAEIQTDVLCCTKCNVEIGSLSNKKVSSDVISADKILINKLSNKYTLSESFDNIDFDTQDVIKGKLISHPTISNKSENIRSDNNIGCATTSNNGTRLVNAIATTTNEKKDEKKKSYKRIRKPSSDSESENHGEVLVKVKKNKYIRDDISIYFDSEEPHQVSNVVNSNKGISLSEESEVNYGEILDNIMKKCDGRIGNVKAKENPKRPRIEENVTHQSTNNIEEHSRKRSKTQDVIRECEMIIKDACSEPLQIDTQDCSTVREPSKFTLAVMEKEFHNNFSGEVIERGNEPSKLTLAVLDKEFSSNFSNVESNNITVRKANIGDKLSESLFTDDNYMCQTNKNDALNNSKQCLNNIIDNFNNLNDSFEHNLDNEVATINEENSTVTQKIEINKGLGQLPDDISSKMERNITTPKGGTQKSSVIFLSDSDSDVVESTPEKNRLASVEDIALFSQQEYYNPLGKPMSQTDGANGFIKPFTPPPEFQDVADEDGNESDSIRGGVMSSITPDLVLPHLMESSPPFKSKLATSTPLTQSSIIRTLNAGNVSPIEKHTNVNPLQAAQNLKALPLTLVRNQTPVLDAHTIGLSTPKQTSILNYIQCNKPNTSQSSQGTSISTPKNRIPCVSSSRMNKEQLLAITSMAKRNLVVYSTTFSESITHMIVVVNENQCVEDHTMKFLLAVASGIWVLGFNWVKECLKQGKIVPEEAFEALDVTGIPGPRQSRLHRFTNPLLKDFKIYAAPPFKSVTQKEVEQVIIFLGGQVVSRPEELLIKNGKVCLIITDPTDSQDLDLYETWLESLHVVTVNLIWLSRSVAQYKRLSIRTFALCSDDSMSELGYPPELIVETSLSSFTQTTTSV